MGERVAPVTARLRGDAPRSPLEEFEQVYVRNIDAITRFFARRSTDPQSVADLTSETFVRAMKGFGGFDPRRGTDRGWLYGIAARVFALHCEQAVGARDAAARLGGYRQLGEDAIEDLAERIDAERDGAVLMRHCADLPADERAAIELVALDGLTGKEAARALGISHAALRKRLSRGRSRITKGAADR